MSTKIFSLTIVLKFDIVYAMKPNQYKITYEHASWFFGDRFGTLIVSAPCEEYAVKQYYLARGKKIPHDIKFVSVEKIG